MGSPRISVSIKKKSSSLNLCTAGSRTRLSPMSWPCAFSAFVLCSVSHVETMAVLRAGMEFAFFTHMSSAPESGTGEQDSNVTLEDLAKWRFYQEVVTVVELLTYKKKIPTVNTLKSYVYPAIWMQSPFRETLTTFNIIILVGMAQYPYLCTYDEYSISTPEGL